MHVASCSHATHSQSRRLAVRSKDDPAAETRLSVARRQSVKEGGKASYKHNHTADSDNGIHAEQLVQVEPTRCTVYEGKYQNEVLSQRVADGRLCRQQKGL